MGVIEWEPQSYQILIPGICKHYLSGKSVFAHVIKDFEIKEGTLGYPSGS